MSEEFDYEEEGFFGDGGYADSQNQNPDADDDLDLDDLGDDDLWDDEEDVDDPQKQQKEQKQQKPADQKQKKAGAKIGTVEFDAVGSVDLSTLPAFASAQQAIADFQLYTAENVTQMEDAKVFNARMGNLANLVLEEAVKVASEVAQALVKSGTKNTSALQSFFQENKHLQRQQEIFIPYLKAVQSANPDLPMDKALAVARGRFERMTGLKNPTNQRQVKPPNRAVGQTSGAQSAQRVKKPTKAESEADSYVRRTMAMHGN